MKAYKGFKKLKDGTPCPYRKTERPKKKQPNVKGQMEMFN